MTTLPGLLAGILLASISTMAPAAMATPQPQEGRVAVGPIGSSKRDWTSVSEAQRLCQQRGCWITDGVETSPGVWTPNTLFPGARSFREPGTGHGLLEVRPR